MLILAHTGITCGAATILLGTVSSFRTNSLIRGSWFLMAARLIDFRILIIGSVLPDIIDKPLGHYFLRDSINFGRIYAHTLLFFIVAAVLGIIAYRRYHSAVGLLFASGTLSHLVLDEMWKTPETLFWPLFGTSFPTTDSSAWFSNMLHALFSDPFLYITESIGAIMLIWLGLALMKNGELTRFLKNGRIPRG